MVDSTNGNVLIYKSPDLATDYEQPLTDGFRLKFFNEDRVSLNTQRSGWTDSTMVDFVFEKLAAGTVQGERRPNDYMIVFDDNVGFGTSSQIDIGGNIFPATDVNFQVKNLSTDKFINFGFIELDETDGAGKLSVQGAKRDRIVFLEENAEGNEVFTWWFYFPSGSEVNPNFRVPAGGDTAYVYLNKPFLAADKFEFVAKQPSVDEDQAKVDMDKIKVVPNPYVATARWEPKNPFTSGRGPRELHFTHLPAKCTIRIFTVSGELVQTIHHDEALNDGTADWDMLSKDNLQISYGVYVYHVEAPGIGEKIGKFAVIK